MSLLAMLIAILAMSTYGEGEKSFSDLVKI